jgi:hypothetical protein
MAVMPTNPTAAQAEAMHPSAYIEEPLAGLLRAIREWNAVSGPYPHYSAAGRLQAAYVTYVEALP